MTLRPSNFSCFKNVSQDSLMESVWLVENPIYPNVESRGSGYAIAAVTSIIFLVGVPWNLFVICVIVWKKLYRSPTYILLMNFAITNLLLCLLVMPFIVITGFSGEFLFGSTDAMRCHVCQFAIVFYILLLISISSLALLAMDRLIYLKKPLTYNDYVTSKRIFIFIPIIWFLSILFSLPPLFGFGEMEFSFELSSCLLHVRDNGTNLLYYVFMILLHLLLDVVSLFLYVWIIYIARKSILSRLRRVLDSKAGMGSVTENTNEARNAQLRLVRIFAVIFTVHFLSWLPTLVSLLIGVTVNAQAIPIPLYNFAYAATLFSAILYPALEVVLLREMRTAIAGCLRFCCRRPKKPPISRTTTSS